MYYGAFGLLASLPGPSLIFGVFGFLPDGLVLTPICFYDPLSFLYFSFQLQNHKNSTGVPRISALIFIKSILESLSKFAGCVHSVFRSSSHRINDKWGACNHKAALSKLSNNSLVDMLQVKDFLCTSTSALGFIFPRNLSSLSIAKKNKVGISHETCTRSHNRKRHVHCEHNPGCNWQIFPLCQCPNFRFSVPSESGALL